MLGAGYDHLIWIYREGGPRSE